MTANLLLYVLLRLARVGLRFIPLRLAYLLADLVGLLAYLAVPKARRGISRNLSVVTGQPVQSRTVQRLARDAFANDAKNWVDTLRIDRVSGEELEAISEVEGWDRLGAALDEGRGVILVTAHLGNFDLVGQLLITRGYRLTIPVERMRPPALFDLLSAERGSKGIRIVPVEEAPRALLRALRAGEIAAVAGDRAAGGKTVQVQFFGRPTQLPSGAASLARRTGAPVVIGLGLRLPGGRFQGFVSHRVEMERTSDPVSDDAANTQRVAETLEGYIRRYPGQWLAFSPLWPQPDKTARVTMNNTEVAV